MELYDLRRIGLSRIKAVIKKIDEKFMQMSDFKFTFYILGLSMMLFLITAPIELILIKIQGIVNIPEDYIFENRGFFITIISSVIISPYLETIIFHAAPLGLYYKLKERFQIAKFWDLIVGVLCGLVFGVLHGIFYPSVLMKGFNFTIIGCLYSYVFFRYRRKNMKGRYGIWIIHALNNLIVNLPGLIWRLFN